MRNNKKRGSQMKKVIFASMFAIGLAACGGGAGGKEATLTKMCVEEGDNTQEECACMATQMVEKLDPDMVDLMVEASKAENEEAFMMEKMAELKPEQMTQFMEFAMSAPGACGIEM